VRKIAGVELKEAEITHAGAKLNLKFAIVDPSQCDLL